MTSPWIDLAAAESWVLMGAAWVLLNVIHRREARRRTLALINLGLVFLLLGPMGLLVVLVGLGLIHRAAVLCDRRRQADSKSPSMANTVVVLAVLVGLFVVHKTGVARPGDSVVESLGRSVLEAVGFSYLLLRAVDLLRQMSDGLAPRPSFLETVNYLIPFNMLTAGPIQKYTDYVQGMAAERPPEATMQRLDRWLGGGERIAAGLVKKFVVAGTIQTVLLADFTTSGWAFVVEANAFYLWLYFDFSAYSDIAVGVGELCGIRTPENFKKPLSARNLTVFWENWHISLSLWVRAHLYIPVQLYLARATRNRHPVLTSTAAFAVAFTLCGLWHDVSIRFLLWGLLHAVGLSVCNAYRYWLVKRHGRKGVRAGYMKVGWIRWASTALTFEFVAASLAFAFYPSFGW